jgi:hypothetical protein
LNDGALLVNALADPLPALLREKRLSPVPSFNGVLLLTAVARQASDSKVAHRVLPSICKGNDVIQAQLLGVTAVGAAAAIPGHHLLKGSSSNGRSGCLSTAATAFI